MIRIDHIEFGFAVPDEGFARRLYADWDGFCRRCFDRVAEECLAPYGYGKALHELERLDLDLGSIPEETFYDEYPRRLREALLAALPPLYGTRMQPDPERIAAARIDNLLHYLKHGHPLPEWEDRTFDSQEEADWLAGQPAAFYHPAIEKLASLCAEDGRAARRLLLQTDNGKLLLELYAAVLALPSAGLQGKKRFLTLLLEARPDIPLRFVHGMQDGNGLRGMAELLDSLSVRILMREEAGVHAEVDLPPYWHYLYEWLIRYYPFNGIAIFGGKAEFTRHLHHRLLTFICKRNYSLYLSKAELTVSFLLEVFGPACYIDVLNAIYELQPLGLDGSPVYDSYFNRELYRMFLRLSLLHLPGAATSPAAINTGGKKEEGIHTDAEALTLWLKDASHDEAEKRVLLATLAKECPELLIGRLQTEATKDGARLSFLMSLTDDKVINRLLASLSFAAVETVETVKVHLHRHRTEIPWLKGVTATCLEQAMWQSVLRWLAKAYPGREDTAETLLQMFYQEVTGNSDETDVGKLAAELELPEARREYAIAKELDTERYMEHLRAILSGASIPEIHKRREVARFWDAHREDCAEAVQMLHTQGLLPGVLGLTGHYAYMEIIRKIFSQTWGGEKAETLLPLFEWFVRHEDALSPYLADNSTGLRTQLLLWIICPEQGTATARPLLAGLFGEAHLPSVLTILTKDIAADGEGIAEMEKILARWQSPLPSAYKEWPDIREGNTRAARLLFESHWQTTEGFGEWLGDAAIPDSRKQKLLRTAATEYPQKWTTLLRFFRKEGKSMDVTARYLPSSVLLQSISRVSFHQAAVLSRLAIMTERHAGTYPFLFAGGKDFQSALSEALLLYMQDADTLERTLTEKDIVEKFLACLHFVYTGKQEYSDDTGWQQLSYILNDETGNAPIPLSDMEGNDAAWRQDKEPLLYRQLDKLSAWMEDVATDKDIGRLADAAGIECLRLWADYLVTVPGFACPDVFRQWTAWLLHLAAYGVVSVKDMVTVLCAWVKGTDWKHQTPQQMEVDFLSKLHIVNAGGIVLPLESLTDDVLPEAVRKRLLQDFLRLHPDGLLEHIRRTTAQGILSVEQWAGLLDTGGWMRLASGLSLSTTEQLRQASGILHLDDEAERLAWASCIINGNKETWLYNRPEEHVRHFVQAAMPRQGGTGMEEILARVLEELHIPATEDAGQTPEIIWVAGAGLCLLAPWLVRLFAMLGYLDEESRKFRDTASKVRAVFLLQYLACGEEWDWREPELAFGRLLTALPGNVPLPKHLALSGEERQTADGMVAGVKANWPQMGGTSVEGFRGSFLLREGTLEEEEERWLLTVEEKAYDLLLETVPWGFRQIRLPWLKKHVQVKWHEKQMF